MVTTRTMSEAFELAMRQSGHAVLYMGGPADGRLEWLADCPPEQLVIQVMPKDYELARLYGEDNAFVKFDCVRYDVRLLDRLVTNRLWLAVPTEADSRLAHARSVFHMMDVYASLKARGKL